MGWIENFILMEYTEGVSVERMESALSFKEESMGLWIGSDCQFNLSARLRSAFDCLLAIHSLSFSLQLLQTISRHCA